MNNNYPKQHRKEILRKLAKNPHVFGINGKHNRKSVERHLSKSTNKFNEAKADLEKAEREAAKLNQYIAEKRRERDLAKKDILDCHEYLRNMDFSGATGIRIGKDKDDVAYACDGKWMHYDPESGDKEMYFRWKRSKNINNEIDEEDDNDADSILDPDGIDLDM